MVGARRRGEEREREEGGRDGEEESLAIDGEMRDGEFKAYAFNVCVLRQVKEGAERSERDGGPFLKGGFVCSAVGADEGEEVEKR